MDGNGLLSFFYKIINRPANGAALPLEVRLYGTAGSIARWTAPNPDAVTDWMHFRIPIEASHWTLLQGTWAQVLADVWSVRIRVRIFTNNSLDTCVGLDSAILRQRQVHFASSATYVAGEFFDGDLSNLEESDDRALRFFNDPVTMVSEVELGSTGAYTDPYQFWFDYEPKAERPGLSQSLSFYNFQTSQWNFIEGRTASTSDLNCEVRLGAAPQFVSGSGEVKARVRWEPINDEDPAQDGWLVGLDTSYWRVL